jgi:hypothetical protein
MQCWTVHSVQTYCLTSTLQSASCQLFISCCSVWGEISRASSNLPGTTNIYCDGCCGSSVRGNTADIAGLTFMSHTCEDPGTSSK